MYLWLTNCNKPGLKARLCHRNNLFTIISIVLLHICEICFLCGACQGNGALVFIILLVVYHINASIVVSQNHKVEFLRQWSSTFGSFGFCISNSFHFTVIQFYIKYNLSSFKPLSHGANV